MENSWMWNLTNRGQGHPIYPGLMPPVINNQVNHQVNHQTFQQFNSTTGNISTANLPMFPPTSSMGTAPPRPSETDLMRNVTASEDEMRIMSQIAQMYSVDMDHFKQWCSQSKGVNVHLAGENNPPQNESAGTSEAVSNVAHNTDLQNATQTDSHLPEVTVPSAVLAPRLSPVVSDAFSTVITSQTGKTQGPAPSSCPTVSPSIHDQPSVSSSPQLPPGGGDAKSVDNDQPEDGTTGVNSPQKRLTYSIMFKLQVAGFQELVKNQHATARAFGLSRDCIRRWSRQKQHLVKKFFAMEKKNLESDKSMNAMCVRVDNDSDNACDNLEGFVKRDMALVKSEPLSDADGESSEEDSETDMNMSCTNEDYDANGSAFGSWSNRETDHAPLLMDCKAEVLNGSFGDKYCKKKSEPRHGEESHEVLDNQNSDSNAYSVDHKLAIIEYYEEHGAMATKKNFRISKKKIMNWIRHKAEFLGHKHSWDLWKNDLSNEFPYSTTLETMLLEWLKNSHRLTSWNMFSCKAEVLSKTVEVIREELGSVSFTCDREYMEQFIEKHGISLCEEEQLVTKKNPSGLGQRKNSYPLSFKLQVIAYFEEGNSKAAAARKFGIARKQVQNWIQSRDHLFKHVHLGNFARLPGCGRKCMSVTLERKLLAWIAESKQQGVRVSHSMLKSKARELYHSDPDVQKECSDKGFRTFHASQGWVRSFLRRNKVFRNVPFPHETKLQTL